MIDESQNTFAVTYFSEWADKLTQEDLEVGLEAQQAPRLLKADARFDPELLDASQYAAATAVSLTPLRRFINRFIDNGREAREEIEKLYELYGSARQELEVRADNVRELLTNERDDRGHDLQTLLMNYVIKGQCKTRLVLRHSSVAG